MKLKRPQEHGILHRGVFEIKFLRGSGKCSVALNKYTTVTICNPKPKLPSGYQNQNQSVPNVYSPHPGICGGGFGALYL